MKNNTVITVAIGAGRKAQTWTNTSMRFADLAHRCRQCVITRETMAEYVAMTRDEQGNVKDVGGFVGGELRDGVRRAGHVVGRQLVCLDLDNAADNAWQRITSALPHTALFVYSTHKHTPQNPRLRLVVLLDRAVSEDEYERTARAVAARVGEDMCDGTTYQATRLMYWPSAPRDISPVYLEQDGAALNTVSLTASTASTTVAVPVEVARGGRLDDPRMKPGLIGAFCRAYRISAAIGRFLRDVYEPAGGGRYTYQGATTTGGLTVYGDLFAYSWHDSDPASMRCCNAFDLVRIHLYGERDSGITETDISRMPSYLAMCDMAGHDAQVLHELYQARLAEAAADFAGMEAPVDEDTGWEDKIERKKNGDAVCSRPNIVNILMYDPKLAHTFARDEMTGNIVVTGDHGLPWDPKARVWTNSDTAALRTYLEHMYGINSVSKVDDALETVCKSRRVHAVRDYFNSLTWDGVRRLDRCLIDYIGAHDTVLTRALTRIFLVAAVARVMEPGIKYDYCLILKGAQGVGKSTWLKILGGDWYKDGLTSMEGKEGAEQVRGSLIIELGELDSMRRTEVTAVKQFITQRADEYRPAYGKVKEVYPRQCVFAGTTNEDVFLKDNTGNRRFKVVEVGTVPGAHGAQWFGALEAARDQIWAEAVAAYRAGTDLFLLPDLEAQSREATRVYDFDNTDPVRGMLTDYLEMRMPYNWYTWSTEKRRQWLTGGGSTLEAVSDEQRQFVCLVEFLSERLGKKPGDKDYQSTALKVQRYLKDEGWQTGALRRHKLYGQQRTFYRPNNICDSDL